MKQRTILISLIMMMISIGAFAESKTKEFKVYGNCGMCEDRIEKAANSVDGVTEADWNKETKMIKVTYDNQKSDINAIQKAIAKAGHDTGKHRAKDETYKNLPGCCQYDRKAEKKASGGAC